MIYSKINDFHQKSKGIYTLSILIEMLRFGDRFEYIPAGSVYIFGVCKDESQNSEIWMIVSSGLRYTLWSCNTNARVSVLQAAILYAYMRKNNILCQIAVNAN